MLYFKYQFLFKLYVYICFPAVQEPLTQMNMTNNLVEMSSMEVHNLVKAKLKLKGVDMNSKNTQHKLPVLFIYEI